MSIFKPKEERTQLFFRDDGRFVFRKLEIEDTFLVQKENNEIKRGWKHFYKLQFPFAGIKGIASDMVSLAYSRDIILDPYGIVADSEKPDKNTKINDNPWITEVAESRIYKHQANMGGMLLAEKITLILAVCVGVMVIAIAIRAVGS